MGAVRGRFAPRIGTLGLLISSRRFLAGDGPFDDARCGRLRIQRRCLL